MSEWLALEPYDRYIPWRDGMNNETVLHELLNSLKDGEHVKATWVDNNHKVTFEGPVHINGREASCRLHIRWDDGIINPFLTSLEVVRVEEVTATRDDEKSLYALVDSLEDGWEVTAELRDEKGSKTFTGAVMVDDAYRLLVANERTPLRWSDGILHIKLHSVTVTRPLVYRWERYDGK